MRPDLIDRRIGADGAPEEVDHAGQRVVPGRASLPRLQPQGRGEPVIARRRGRGVLLAQLAGDHRALGEAGPLGAVLLAPDAERLRADGAGEGLRVARVRARRLQIELLGSRDLVRLSPPGPGGVGVSEKLRGGTSRRRTDGLDRRRLVQRLRATSAEHDRGDAPHRTRR